MICMDDIHGWYAWMIYMDEIHGWYTWMISMHDIHGARPGQTQKYIVFSVFWHEWASYRRYEALDRCKMKDFSNAIDLTGSQGRFIGSKGSLYEKYIIFWMFFLTFFFRSGGAPGRLREYRGLLRSEKIMKIIRFMMEKNKLALERR